MSEIPSPTEFLGNGLTRQQQDAVACRAASVVLSSGAGCGKTHVLTERFFAHLREGAEVGHLVALTFTDRAARNMRARIRKKVVEAVRSAATEEEADRWAEHLRGLETASISTIHAFCGALLRQHAVEAGLDPHFDVLEDMLAVNLENAALTECLQRLLTADTTTGEDLRQLILLYGWRPTVEAVQTLPREWSPLEWRRWLELPEEQLASRWLTEDRPRVLAAYVAHLVVASPKIAGCLAKLRTIECIGPLMRANVARVLEETPRLAEVGNLAAAIEELTEAAKVGKEQGKAWRSTEDYEAIKKALADYRDELREKLRPFAEPAENVAATIAVGKRFLRVAEAAARTYQQHKRRAGVLDFQDLLVQARDLLRDRADLREAIQHRVRFLLVDELQDTDPVQMELIEHLTGGGLTAGKLFAVGDHKQSIYRFRRAEVALFQRLRRQVPSQGRLDLSRNFRSQPAILDFTNALLGHRLEDYRALEPHRSQTQPGPCVEFLWAPAVPKDVEQSRRREADLIARRIAAMIGRRETLVVEKNGDASRSLRPVRHQDIVLLFRAMTNASIYENSLRNYGIDYYLVGGRAFFAQQEIYDLLNLLRALENPRDAASVAGTLRSPFCCLSDETLFILATHPEGLWAGLHDADVRGRLTKDQRAAAERSQCFLDRWRGLKDRVPIAQLLGEVFADSGYDAATQFEFLGDRNLANLWKLLDMARAFDRTGLFGLADFMARLSDQVRAQPREEQAATQPENAQVVRLMSIHQAKGLEFPVVFVPDFAAQGRGGHHPAAVWDAPFGCVAKPPADEDEPPFSGLPWKLWETGEKIADWHEDMRTLYVACTRAEDYLVLSASLPESFASAASWMLTLAERFDPRTGACRDESIPPKRRPAVRVVTPDSPELAIEKTSLGASSATDDSEQASFEASHVARNIAPIAACLTSRDIVPLAALEEHLRTGKRLSAASLAQQFAAENGADRNEWLSPRERLGDEPLDRGVGGTLEQSLAAMFPEMADAAICYRDLEFAVEVDEALPPLRGRIDRLWQDRGGDWHLLALAARPEEWGPIVTAWAVARRFGKWPKTVRSYSFAEKKISEPSGPPAQRLAEVRAALNGLLGQPLAAE